MPLSPMLRTAVTAALVTAAAGHAGMIIPTSRNSIDRLAPGFSVDGTGPSGAAIPSRPCAV